MTEMLRECPGCGGQREFAQHHPCSGQCPDSADPRCPEWICLRCGAGLLVGLLPSSGDRAAASARFTAGQLDRVA